MPYRKNVFFLGAGASAHTGAPLMSGFLEAAREICDGGSLAPEDASRFKNVLNYRNQHDLLEQQASVDLTNLEDLFGLVELNLRVEPEVQGLRKDLVFLILKTLEKKVQPEIRAPIQVLLRDQRTQPHQARPLEHLLDIVAGRWGARPGNGMARDSIVSLNYDLAVERAMAARGLAADYCLGDALATASEQAGQVRINLLKLHGSSNWAVCVNVNCRRVTVASLEASSVSKIETASCQNCGCSLEPLIVPPTWSKGEHREPLQGVWQKAFNELMEARRWVIIGASLPETDQPLRYLLALALYRNRDLDRILVINPAQGVRPAQEPLYGGLFGRLPGRMRYQHVSTRFSDAVSTTALQQGLDQVYEHYEHQW